MALIRVGLIGLSATPQAWANAAHLPFLVQSTNGYKIVALANSSIDSARAAIKFHQLPADTKAYGSPSDIAADPDVDLVVVSVNVLQHYDLIKPALLAGKSSFVEWPLGRNLAEAEELTALAKASNVKTVVGLQGRQAPSIQKLKAIIAEGRIGKVLSTTLVVETGGLVKIPQRYRSLLLNPVGGGLFFAVYLGHTIDPFIQVLGHFTELSAQLANQNPLVDVVEGTAVVETGVRKETADHFNIHGTLDSGAVASISFRNGSAFPGTPSLTWKIYGEKGQILATTPTPFYQVNSAGLSIQISDSETATVEDVAVTDDKESLPVPARNVGRTYEALAKGEGQPTFVDALLIHRVLDAFQRSSDTGKRVSYKRD